MFGLSNIISHAFSIGTAAMTLTAFASTGTFNDNINASSLVEYASQNQCTNNNLSDFTETAPKNLESSTSTGNTVHNIISEGDGMKNKNLTAIKNMRQFEENWNGYGAKGFTNELCNFLESIIKSLDEDIQPKIFPTGRESIQLEYEKRNGEYLEFEIFSPERIEMFRILNNQEEIEKSVDLDEFKGLVKDFNEI